LSSNETRQDVQHTTECVANMELLTGPFRQVSSQMANVTALSCQTEGTFSQQADKELPQ